MRVLHVLLHVDGKGNGIVNAAIDLASAQLHAGAEVALVSGGGEHEALLERIGIPHFLLHQARNPVNLARAAFRLRGYLREFQPDVVHAHMMTSLVLAKCWSALMGFPLVAHVHNVHQRESVVMGLADRVIAVSASVGETMAASGIPRRKIRVVLNRPLGSPRMADVRAASAVSLEHPAVVTVAGMYERKGISDLIEAFARLADAHAAAHLYLVGDGPDIERFRGLAAETQCAGRIHFMGFSEQSQGYMAAADVFVLASRREALGLVLIEARAAGCAILASDADGMPEALDFGQAGLLYPAGNVDRLTEALRTMLDDDGERECWRERAGTGLERWDYRAMADEVRAVYREIMRPKDERA